jgi:hypothetical protein
LNASSPDARSSCGAPMGRGSPVLVYVPSYSVTC